MAKFRKKPVIVDAIPITTPITIPTREGVMSGNVGNWLITGIANEKYPCQHDIFVASYEPVDQEAEDLLGNVLPHPEQQFRVTFTVDGFGDFRFSVPSIEQAANCITLLRMYEGFVIGKDNTNYKLEVLDDGWWVEWHDEDHMTLNDIIIEGILPNDPPVLYENEAGEDTEIPF